MSDGAECVLAFAVVSGALWLAYKWPEWEGRKRDRLRDREALTRFPDQAAVLAVLRPSAPCGCRADWATGPPSAMGCSEHSWPGGLFAAGGPTEEILMAWRARDLLRRKGEWK